MRHLNLERLDECVKEQLGAQALLRGFDDLSAVLVVLQSTLLLQVAMNFSIHDALG